MLSKYLLPWSLAKKRLHREGRRRSGLLPLRFSSQPLRVSTVPMLCPWSTDQYLNVGYEWAQKKKNRSARETAVSILEGLWVLPAPQSLRVDRIWPLWVSGVPRCIISPWTSPCSGRLIYLWTGYFVSERVFIFTFARGLKFFINVGKESGLSHTLGKGISSILKKKRKKKKLPYQCTWSSKVQKSADHCYFRKFKSHRFQLEVE